MCTYSYNIFIQKYSPILLSKLTIQSGTCTLFHEWIADQNKKVGLHIVIV